MVSLTWVYVISLSIVSAAGMASAFVGNRFYPIKGGDLGIPPPTPAQVATATASANELAKRLRDASLEDKPTVKKVETPTEQPDLKEKLMERLQVDDETAQDITDFIKTPVVDWKKIADNEVDFQTKYMKVYDALQRLPTNLQALYKLVDDKHSDMTGYMQNRPHTKKGDETKTAMSILSSTE